MVNIIKASNVALIVSIFLGSISCVHAMEQDSELQQKLAARKEQEQREEQPRFLFDLTTGKRVESEPVTISLSFPALTVETKEESFIKTGGVRTLPVIPAESFIKTGGRPLPTIPGGK